MVSNFVAQSNSPNLYQTLKSTENNVLYNRLNCVRVCIVDEFYPETKTVKVTVVNKITVAVNKDGSSVVKDFPPIYAKVAYVGWGDINITYPIEKGSEGFLLFNDRELESWYINGGANPLAYDRCHDLSDAIFVSGLQSQPNLQPITNTLHIQYKTSSIDLSETGITINGNTVVSDLHAINGATGNIIDSAGRTLATVTNGIITGIA